MDLIPLLLGKVHFALRGREMQTVGPSAGRDLSDQPRSWLPKVPLGKRDLPRKPPRIAKRHLEAGVPRLEGKSYALMRDNPAPNRYGKYLPR